MGFAALYPSYGGAVSRDSSNTFTVSLLRSAERRQRALGNLLPFAFIPDHASTRESSMPKKAAQKRRVNKPRPEPAQLKAIEKLFDAKQGLDHRSGRLSS